MFSAPTRTRGLRVDVESEADICGAQGWQRISGESRSRGNVREYSPIRAPELKRAVRLWDDLITLFMDASVMPPAEQREIRECRRATRCPMMDVMSFGDP